MIDIKTLLAESARILAASQRERELTAAAFGIALPVQNAPAKEGK